MKRSYLISLALGFIIFEAVLIAFVDRPLSEYLHGIDAQHPDYIDIFRAYTDIGKSKWWLILSGAGIAVCALATRLSSLQETVRNEANRFGQTLLFFFASVALSGIIADIIKPIIGRARPVILDREGFYGFHPFSFHATMNGMPSGHATTAFAIASVLTYFYPRGQTSWLLFASALAVSRVMVNAHYLSDIFAGAALGFVTVVVLRRLIGHTVTHHIVCCIFPIAKSIRTES